VVREYRPDYGVDLAVELFDVPADSSSKTYETLGEHIFLQVKSHETGEISELEMWPRGNVEKPGGGVPDRSQASQTIPVVAQTLETTELVTVQRMGPAVPVLLVTVDIEKGSAAFVCLNDYVDKVIAGEDPKYDRQGSHTIYVPHRNQISSSPEDLVRIRHYARRAKLYAAFQKFAYQANELGHAGEHFRNTARYFADVLLRYDFWHTTEYWAPIRELGLALRNVSEGRSPGMMTYDAVTLRDVFGKDGDRKMRQALEDQEVAELWRQLALLGRIYEDVVREWFLPTVLGQEASS
jgi:hypothetical protein